MSENLDLEQVRRLALAVIISPRKDFRDLKQVDPKVYQSLRSDITAVKQSIETTLDLLRCALERLNACED